MFRPIAAAVCLAWGAPALAAGDCAALEDVALKDVNPFSATLVPASEDLPEYCAVRGTIRPAISFEAQASHRVERRFYMAGCGGFCGQLAPDAPGFVNAMNYGLRRGYAAATMDGGHWGTGSTDARWALANRIAEVDWGERAVRETAKASQALVAIYYGTDPHLHLRRVLHRRPHGEHARGQGSRALRRHPERRSRARLHRPRSDLHVGGRPGQHCGRRQPIITPDVVPLIGETLPPSATRRRRRGRPRLRPGRLQSRLHRARLRGRPEQPMSEAEQVATLDVWYTKGATNSAGEPLYPATIPPGSELFWPLWLTGNDTTPPLVPLFNKNFLASWPSRTIPARASVRLTSTSTGIRRGSSSWARSTTPMSPISAPSRRPAGG